VAHSLVKGNEVCKNVFVSVLSSVIKSFYDVLNFKGHTNYPFIHKNAKNNEVDRIDEIGFDKFIMRYNKVTAQHFRENFELLITVPTFSSIERLQQLLVRVRMLRKL
jgi:hypothetical protein